MNWLKKLAQKLKLKIIPECVGYSHGQTDCVLKAFFNDKLVGYISYAIFQGDIFVQYIETAENMRRQGIASQLVEALKKEAKEINGEIDWGNSTIEGTDFLEGIGIR